jgi:hypothetical protein
MRLTTERSLAQRLARSYGHGEHGEAPKVRFRVSFSIVSILTLSLFQIAIPLDIAAEETKVIQGMYLSLSGTETRGNPDSPFARLAIEPDSSLGALAALDIRPDWNLDADSYSNYSLRFSTRDISGQAVASAQGGPSSGFAIAIDQAWVKASFGEGWGLAFGRRELKWKDGGYWNPSDVVNNSLVWNSAGEAPGRDSVELFGLIPFTDLNLDLSAAVALASGIENPAELPYYLALGSILYPFELRAKLAVQDGRQPLVGAAAKLSLSSGNLYADGLYLRDHPLARTDDDSVIDATFPERGNWFRYCVGGDWTLDTAQTRVAETLSMRLEYLRQDDGLGADQMKAYFSHLGGMQLDDPSAATDPTAVQAVAYGLEAKKWGGRFFALGKDYLFASFTLGELAKQHISLTEACVLNIDDLSFALRSSLSWSPRNLLTISATAANYGGKAGGEALMLPYSAQYTLSLSRSF